MTTELWKVVLWGFGTCISGFLFLAGWMWWMLQKLHEKVSYDWLENQFQSTINKNINEIKTTLVEIKEALVGNFKDKGIITKVDEHARELHEIKENCIKQHGE